MDGVVALLDEAREVGLRVSVDGDLLRIRGSKVNAAFAEQLRACKPDILALLNDEREREVLYRVDMFRPQVPETGPIPFLVFAAAIAPRTCPACGKRLRSTERYRCGLFADAARRVVLQSETRLRLDDPAS